MNPKLTPCIGSGHRFHWPDRCLGGMPLQGPHLHPQLPGANLILVVVRIPACLPYISETTPRGQV